MHRTRHRRTAAVAILAVTVVAAAVTTGWHAASASVTGDAAARSGEAVGVVEYRLGDTAFTDPPDWEGNSELTAVVHYPRAMHGRAPLIVQLHGQAYSCATDGEASWPCPQGVASVPSYRGYDYLGEALARRGFVVVSLSANGINHYMGIAKQRADLINRHLAMWQELAATGRGPLAGRFVDPDTGRRVAVDFTGKVDMQRVGTFGHSVAGIAVMRQAADRFRSAWPRGVTVRAVVPIASRYFEENEGDNSDILVTRVPFAVVSAACWGLADHQYFENARGRNTAPAYLVTVQGANHNFFNTVWSPSSGQWAAEDDSTCPDDPARLSETTERQFAIEYLTAFFERTLRDDRSFDGVLTGAQPLQVPGVHATFDHLPPAR